MTKEATIVAAPIVEKEVIPETDLVYMFKISRRAHPVQFKNLWQLIVKTPSDEKAVEIIDADSLDTVVNRLRSIFEDDGL